MSALLKKENINNKSIIKHLFLPSRPLNKYFRELFPLK
jgi:hypothetical protein